jgi:DNA-binding NarL/FixJ family response regulator
MIKVLIADDHSVVRQGIRQILRDVPELTAVGEASSGEQTLEKLRKEEWDLVIMDISMPGRNGLEILKLLQHERPKLPVLVLSMHSEDQFAVRMLKAGAAGYLTKESAPDELVKAIRKIITGGRYVSPSLAEKLAFNMHPQSDRQPHEILSDREFQVMRMLAQGKTVKEIGEELTLSVKTISTYRARVLEKLKLRTNAQLIHYAIQNGLID